jgi:site-specific DNA-methyltransferase (adenine-specific)
MTAYLFMMAERLIQLHRVLKPSGSIFLHCDPTASHYLKVIMDAVFEPHNFRNEIVWKRSNPKGLTSKRFANNHDTILAYSKDASKTRWNPAYIKHDQKAPPRLTRRTRRDAGIGWNHSPIRT